MPQPHTMIENAIQRGDGAASPIGEVAVGALVYSRVLHLLLIALFAGLAYANSLQVPFLFDDQPSIPDNPVIRDLGNFLLHDTGYRYNPGRFVGYLSFALNYRLGGVEVVGYHLFNIAVHLGNALLVYALALITFETPFFRDSRPAGRLPAVTGPSRATCNGIALLAALIFVVHPLQTQAVTYIVQRLTSLMTLFFLLALVLYALMRQRGEASRPRVLALYLGSLAAVLLAMKTKQNAFTLPAVIALYEFFFFRGAIRKRLLRLVPFFLTLLVIPLSLLDLQKPMGAVISEVSKVTQYKSPLSRLDYLYTQFRVIVTYLRLLVFPVDQNLDYDYPLYHSLFAAPVFASLSLLLALAGAGYYLWRRSATEFPELRLASFGICYFFITLSVESSVIPITDVIYEHRVYLSSAGAFLTVATLLVSLAARVLGSTGRKALLCSCCAAIVVLCLLTFQRNKVWASSVSLWEDVVGKSPGKARGYNNLGAAYTDAGSWQKGGVALNRALVLDPTNAEAYYNLGRLYLGFPDRAGEAVAALKTAIRLKPDYEDAFVNLAAAYIRVGNPAESIRILERVLAETAERADAHFNLAVAYSLVGDLPGALREDGILRRLEPRMAGQLEQYLDKSGAPAPPRN